jgi:L-threonylcarbamoyladenylate synthase
MATHLPFEEIQAAIEILRKGGLILYPTDTIWGIGCDACNNEAVQKIYSIKKRDASKSMIILAADTNMVDRYVNVFPEIAEELFDTTDSPLTIILPDARNLANDLPADDQSIGIRIPDDPFCVELLRRFRRPIVSTSANFSGEPSPSNFSEINPDLIEKMDHVAKWRQNDQSGSKASSIIKIDINGSFKIIR